MLVNPFPIDFSWSTVEREFCVPSVFPHANNSGPRPYLEKLLPFMYYERILLWLVVQLFSLPTQFFLDLENVLLSIASIINL